MSATLACYFPAEDPLFLEVDISLNRRVCTLVKEIYLKLRSYERENVRWNDLRVFKTDLPILPAENRQSRVLQWMYEQPSRTRLDPGERLSSVFPDYSNASDKLDIIIVDSEVQELVNNLGDPYGAYNIKVKKALNQCLDARLSLPSPSEAVQDAHMLNIVFGEEGPRIHIGRPGEVPVVIFNPILATLKQNLDHLEQIDVSPWDISNAGTYIRCATRFYKDEEQRQCALEWTIRSVFPGKGMWGRVVDLELDRKGKGKPNGQVVTPGCSWWQGDFLVQVLQLKNSSGIAGDALHQAIIDYSIIVSGDQYKPFRGRSNFPTILLGVTANRLEIAVAVSVGSIHVSRLLTLDVSLGFHASDNLIRLARVFEALRCCQQGLEDYYEGLASSPHPTTLSFKFRFPNPTLIDPSKTLPQLTFRQFLSQTGQPTSNLVDLGCTTTTMYVATLGVEDHHHHQEVIVKFTARYNEAAHRLLAEAELAPKLLFCERVVGDLYMVVMERVSGTSIEQLRRSHICKAPIPIQIPEIVPMKVEEAVRLLHEQNIVFGDLRPNNILYVRSGNSDSDSHTMVLVDFDWAGKDGESRYPATLNKDMKWHSEVGPYGIMRKSHDLWQLDKLRDLCTRYNA